jgi:photosystem II stability/assembly factor-like uncharacterized protein
VTKINWYRSSAAALIAAASIAGTIEAQSPADAAGLASLQWRMIGPHRAGRTVGATGVRQQPSVFYIGVNNGGVWKTNDYGRTWFPIFDDQPTSSIGDVVVAPSDPNIVYVATGEGLQRPDLSTGDGVYKSTDAGKTWRHLPGLRDVQQIGGMVVDPRNPNRVYVAALGHPYGANTERGIYRSTDGGATWQQVLYKDENTGAIQVTIDPNNPDIVYADLWAGRQGPWENATWNGPLSGLYKTVDGGDHWAQMTAGLPTPAEGLGRIGFGIAPSDSRRLYATVDAGNLGGIYRSDDAGATWYKTTPDQRFWGRGSDFAEIKVDPRNADIVYSANVVTWKSVDGGKNWKALKGAPGGDDYHRIWINPDNPDIMLLGVDQGATLTVNGGQTWSSWYNQPTAQFYHVITDNQVPYHVYGSQQESGSVGITSRGDYGAIIFSDWNPVGSEEYGYVAPDPLDANIIYGGKISRFDQRTREVQNISPAPASRKYRYLRTAPIIFSHVDPHVLYFAGNVLFKTTNGGHSWDVISPDLTRVDYDVPPSYGMYTNGNLALAKNRGVIYSIGPSFKDVNTIWTGSDDGYIQLTRDGGATWKNVTPPAMTPWSKVAQIEASHFDDVTAYAAVNRFKLDDLRPHIYRTHDGGTTWQETVSGIPDNEIVNAVREDPVRKGLLFAGTERAVYYSLDDGDHWTSLRGNMPATSIRDLVLHDDDIVVGTHGRSFWILDDYSPIRQMGAAVGAGNAYLFKPKLTYRFRRDKWTDTPLPPEEPAGLNPPDGAMINYTIKSAPKTPVKLEIVDAGGRVVRAFSSSDSVKPIVTDIGNWPLYWLRQPQPLSASPGTHRFVWDLHWPVPDVSDFSYPISAVPHDTPPVPMGPSAMPGDYTVRLTVDGKTYTQPLTLKMDPRSGMTSDALQQQFDNSVRAWDGIHRAAVALREVRAVRARIRANLDASSKALDSLAATFEGAGGRFGGGGGANAAPTFAGISGTLTSLLDDFEGADAMPTTQAVAALNQTLADLDTILARWKAVNSTR